MTAQDLADVRALAERESLAPPAEYQRGILRVALALLDMLTKTEAPAEVAPEVKRGRPR